jgi:hypothetical protein
MKNIYKFLVLILTISISACKDSDELAEDGNVLSVVETSVSFSATGGNDGYIKVNTTGDYTATSDQSWCTLSIDGDVIKVTATANSQLGSRAALVTIVSGNKKKEVAVYQHGVQLSVEKTELIFDLEEGLERPQKIKFSVNAIPTVTVADSWITVTIVRDSLVVYCSASTEKRSTTITIRSGEAAIVITVVQKTNIAYEVYLGEWTLTGTDIFTGEEITYPNIVVTENVRGESYFVTGWNSHQAFANMKFVMDYDRESQEVGIRMLQDAGSYGSYSVYFMAAIYIPDIGLDYLYNEVVGLKGLLKQGKINWEYQTVFDYYYRIDCEVLGMTFMLPETFDWDDHVLYNAVLTKK